MIYGIGIDMVEIARIDQALNRWGDRFTARIFTEQEILYCNGMAKPAAKYALRFAAKEAFSKALGLGFRDGLGFRQIEILRNDKGMPYLRLFGASEEQCLIRGITRSFVSLSDDGLYAVAVVVLETR